MPYYIENVITNLISALIKNVYLLCILKTSKCQYYDNSK